MKTALVLLAVAGTLTAVPSLASAGCTATGFYRDGIDMTAAEIDPPTVTGEVDATGCNVGVYYDAGHSGLVQNADIHGANYFGVLVDGDAGAAAVDVLDSSIHDIGESPLNGAQHGVAIYYRGFFAESNVTGQISGNQITGYQKGGIVANGEGTVVTVSGNTVVGSGHVDFIAQNGIQIGYGALAQVSQNTVVGNSYIGFPGDGSASGGIIVVGGPGYGVCPDGNDCPYTVGTKVTNNVVIDNDVGIYLTNLAADYSAPTTATNVKATNNTLSDDQCYNKSYQAAISDVGNGDKMVNDRISGAGYIGCLTFYNPNGNAIDADASFTNNAKVHATKIE